MTAVEPPAEDSVQGPKMPTVDRSAFVQSATTLMDDYLRRMSELRGRLAGVDAPAPAPPTPVERVRLSVDETVLRAGAEQLARYVSQEIEHGDLERGEQLKLSVKLAEFETAIRLTQAAFQEPPDESKPATSARGSLFPMLRTTLYRTTPS